VWADFATDDKGGDLIALFAAANNLDQGAAARLVAREIGFSIDRPGIGQRPAAHGSPVLEPVTVPDNPNGQPDHVYNYRDIDGNLLSAVARWDAKGDRAKIIRPLSYLETSLMGARCWQLKGPARPKPLYGLPLLKQYPDAEVLLVEGESCADAFNGLGVSGWIALTFMGGSHGAAHADYTPLNGRRVILWPDNDEPGRQAMVDAKKALDAAGAASVRELDPGSDKPDKWIDAAKVKAATAKVFIPTWDNEPQDVLPLIKLNHTGILSPGNISLLTAAAGAGKSSVLEAAAAAAIVGPLPEPGERDTLGLTIMAKRVLYIDTERSTRHHWESWRRYMRRAGILDKGTVPDAVTWVNLRGMDTVETRLAWLWSSIDRDNGPELVLLDGAGDFVKDVNESEECTTFVYKLCAICHQRNIGIITTLHNNPAANNEKARGVLGSELWRKAESVLVIKKNANGARTLTTDYSLGKNRSGSDTVSTSFTWSEEHGMHITTDTPTEVQPKSKTVKERETIVMLMGSNSWAYSDLVKLIMRETSRAERTAKSRIGELLNLNKIRKSEIDNLYWAEAAK
jgi:hypothetical protein